MDVNRLKHDAPGYPEILSGLPGAPKELFWAGKDPDSWTNRPKVAVVGSRKITPYGKVATARITGDLARAGVVIISGLAYGVDIAAHQAALQANGVTVAVLPSSITQIYPAAHAHIAQQITLRGTLLSEYESDVISFKSNFIARNRIVSGLADVLLITEAAVNSGSLHTARFALEQGKTVMAVPGNITSPISEGANNLIKSGAVPVTSAEDVFFALGLNPAAAKSHHYKGSTSEQIVLRHIKEGLTDQEDLALATRLDSPPLASAQTKLEI